MDSFLLFLMQHKLQKNLHLLFLRALTDIEHHKQMLLAMSHQGM